MNIGIFFICLAVLGFFVFLFYIRKNVRSMHEETMKTAGNAFIERSRERWEKRKKFVSPVARDLRADLTRFIQSELDPQYLKEVRIGLYPAKITYRIGNDEYYRDGLFVYFCGEMTRDLDRASFTSNVHDCICRFSKKNSDLYIVPDFTELTHQKEEKIHV